MGNIKKITPIGKFQTYDLEVNHSDHQFYLSNGMLTSNSHSILYSMISYKTAYLKAHYPIEFLLANLMAEVKSNSPDAKANIEKIKKEIRQHKVKIIAPDINKSLLSYTMDGDDKLITGLDALKYVGDDAINDIIAKRPFVSFLDFMSRVDSKKVRANTIQALAASGCLDSFNLSRKHMFLYCSDYRKKLQVWMKKHDPTKEEFIYPWTTEEDWSTPEKYALEQYYLNEAFVCKPYQAYKNFFSSDHKTIKDIKKAGNKVQLDPINCIVRSFFEFKVKKETSKYYGMPMIKAIIEDKNGEQCSCTIFPDRWADVQKRIKEINSKAIFDTGIALSFTGSTNIYEDDIGVILNGLFNVALPPSVPSDLKPKKINLKLAKSAKGEALVESNVIEDPTDISNLLEKIEDALFDEGLIDIEDNEDD